MVHSGALYIFERRRHLKRRGARGKLPPFSPSRRVWGCNLTNPAENPLPPADNLRQFSRLGNYTVSQNTKTLVKVTKKDVWAKKKYKNKQYRLITKNDRLVYCKPEIGQSTYVTRFKFPSLEGAVGLLLYSYWYWAGRGRST